VSPAAASQIKCEAPSGHAAVTAQHQPSPPAVYVIGIVNSRLRDMSDTIFGKIIRGEIPANIVYEDVDLMAFEDANPQAPVHVLFIPKEAIASADLLEDRHAELVGRLVLAARRYAREIGIAENGYRLIFNTNGDGGQSVFHLHLHLLGGRPLGWPPG